MGDRAVHGAGEHGNGRVRCMQVRHRNGVTVRNGKSSRKPCRNWMELGLDGHCTVSHSVYIGVAFLCGRGLCAVRRLSCKALDS